ncbi:efflux RND transporter periplasmic adaptor subunit [Opitutales bacterium ASA1]|uniref:efflux RND transporter periplasmic adaptor subunit n=1 Tax=Congregicoccus parvus TaxID=3081749 RepID=UPI002B298828|nr:efflux RND transporter periplasmic adaptor subunit [Opitutales bacterium ASA1]
MSRKILFALLGIAAVAAAVLVPRYFSRQQAAREPAAEARPAGPQGGPRGPQAVRVIVHRVEPRNLAEKITASGTILANESIELRSEISGKIVAIGFEEGGRVSKGDLLVKINDSELQAQLRQTLHRIDLARTRVERQEQLLAQGSVAQDAFDSAANEVRVLEAGADLIRAQLEKTEIRAPFSGQIGLRMVSVGGYITPTTPIATLKDIDRLKIDFSVSERHVERLHSGSPITFTVSGSAERFSGEVFAIEPGVDVQTRSVLLRAYATNTGGRLLPGAFASVEVTLDEIPDAILVPTNAIIPGLDQRSLFVVEDGRARLRTVETGVRLDREIQIVSGLAPGEVVVTTGLLQLRNGTPVEPLDS